MKDPIYQQSFIDSYSKVACAKLYDRKTPITAADTLNDRGTEYCGNPERRSARSARHEYELYLAIEDNDHSRTKARSPQTNRATLPASQASSASTRRS